MREVNSSSLGRTLDDFWERIKTLLPSRLSQLINDAGYVNAAAAAAAAPVQSVNGKTGDVTVDALVYLGSNPLSNTTNDTPGNWRALGSGFALYGNDGYVIDQPSPYGYLLSFVKAQFVSQLWVPYGTAANAHVYYRNGHIGNANVTAGWKKSWTRLLEQGEALPAQASSETLSFASVSAVGYGYVSNMTSSSKVAQVLIPMPNNASSVAITYSGTWTLATDAGTVAISAITVRKVTRAGIHCAVTMDTTLTPTLATPVTLKCTASATMTITWS